MLSRLDWVLNELDGAMPHGDALFRIRLTLYFFDIYKTGAKKSRDFMKLSPTVFDILLCLHSGPTHGYAIIKTVHERGGPALPASLLYTVLPKMIDANLIEEAPAPADNTDNRRRYYRLTQKGQKSLIEENDRRLQEAQKNNDILRGQA